MLTYTEVFSSFSTDDAAAAKKFYGETLGLEVSENPLGGIDVRLPNGGQLFIYEKPNHQPATFTVLHFGVDDIEKTVDELNASGVQTKIYGDAELPDMPNDSKGIWRGDNNEALMAWLKDPAGNVIGLMSTDAQARAAMQPQGEGSSQSPQ